MNRIATTEEHKTKEHYSNVPTVPVSVDKNTTLDEINLNWTEKDLPEKERTKHVHRFHPYLGKYIPQLVEIFMRKYFCAEQIILDPFVGSGTTLVQANELGINSIGSDISEFNILLSRVKTKAYNFENLEYEASELIFTLESKLLILNDMDDKTIHKENLKRTKNQFLLNWFSPIALFELFQYKDLIKNYYYLDFFNIVLSRAARSSRLTTHFNLDFPKEPVISEYWCHKHRRNCKPVNESYKFLKRYTLDSLKRAKEYSKYRTNARVRVIHGDSRNIQFPQIDGVITSPPYVGLIDYHEQHRYSYELLGLTDRREEEIGAASNGKSIRAKEEYIDNISSVFNNVAKVMKKGGIFIVVAGDKSDLYSKIFQNTELKFKEKLERHVNRRTGRRKNPFFETVFIYEK